MKSIGHIQADEDLVIAIRHKPWQCTNHSCIGSGNITILSLHEEQNLAYWIHVSNESFDSIYHHRIDPSGTFDAKVLISSGIRPTITFKFIFYAILKVLKA